ncbi:ABC transporter substrate-binding protein [Candidatus Poriferisocius sp.]|uniref:ABC transporter substrate-binding protein n=1 Tax=Candidatus Poriferisocius sp. TaxID=3101276 RepID=UPI003B5BB6D0
MTTPVSNRPLRVGVFTTSSVLAAAEGLGLFAQNGIEVDVEEVKGSGQQMKGLREGTLHVVHTSPDNVMKARLDDGDDVFVFFVQDTGLPQLLVGRAGVDTWGKVQGGRIGVDDPKSGFAFVVYEMLKGNGVSVEGCDVVSVGTSRQRLDALIAGDIEVGLLSAAMSARISEAGLTVLAGAADAVPWYPGVAAATSRAVADSRPDDIGAYTRSLHDAMKWASDSANTEVFRAHVADYLDITSDEAARIIDREARARTSTLPDAVASAEAVAKVADMRAAHTGQTVEGAFDARWVLALAP